MKLSRGFGRRARSLSIALVAAVAVIGLLGSAVAWGSSLASAASKSVAPRITSVPGSLSAGAPAIVTAQLPSLSRPGAKCRLDLVLGSRVRVRSRGSRALGGELQFVWTVPQRVRSGRWTAEVRCGGTRHVSRATIRVRGSHGDSANLASRITVVVLEDDRMPGASGLGAAGYQSYGTVVVPGSAWFGGHGVNVYSNGCGDCFPSDVGSDYGSPRWQCVNLIERFVHAENFGPTIWGNANELYNAVRDNSSYAPYYAAHANSSGYVPVPGDIITFGQADNPDGYGHVVIVTAVTSTSVEYVEQNASAAGKGYLSLSGSTIGAYDPSLPVIGIIHAIANKQVEPNSNPSTTTSTPTTTTTTTTTTAPTPTKCDPHIVSSGYDTPCTYTVGAYQVYGTGSDGLYQHTGPGTTYPKITNPVTLPEGATVDIACQVITSSVVNGSGVWDLETDGDWVSDYYINTPVVGNYSPGLAQCGGLG